MKSVLKFSAVLFAASTVGANAFMAPTVSVPEISAVDGVAALAVVAALVALVWERRRSA